jgi:hypothetical protein
MMSFKQSCYLCVVSATRFSLILGVCVLSQAQKEFASNKQSNIENASCTKSRSTIVPKIYFFLTTCLGRRCPWRSRTSWSSCKKHYYTIKGFFQFHELFIFDFVNRNYHTLDLGNTSFPQRSHCIISFRIFIWWIWNYCVGLFLPKQETWFHKINIASYL